MAIYVVADIHGYYDVFHRGLDLIEFNEDDQLYVIGDAIDRGPDGICVLLDIMSHRNMDLLIGNHEFMMLNSVNMDGEKCCDGIDTSLWLDYNGGRTTWHGYKTLRENDRISLMIWLSHRYVMKTIELNGVTYCLTHSYYKEGLENKAYYEMAYGNVWNIVWSSPYREDFETKAIDIYSSYNMVFVTGHVPVQSIYRWHEGRIDYNALEIYMKGNYIGIDGGCAYGKQTEVKNGALFLRLDDMEVFPVAMSDM